MDKFEVYTSRINNMIDDAFFIDSSYFPSYRRKAINILKRVVLFDPDNERAKYYLSCLQIALKNKPPAEPKPEPDTPLTWITDPAPPGPSSSHPYSCRCYKCVEGDFEWRSELTDYAPLTNQ